jgi:quaternary ammonium compound-resistance protein SugE
MKTIPTSMAFAVWTAVSMIFIKIIDLLFFHDKLSLIEFFFLALIMIGIIGLKMIAKP